MKTLTASALLYAFTFASPMLAEPNVSTLVESLGQEVQDLRERVAQLEKPINERLTAAAEPCRTGSVRWRRTKMPPRFIRVQNRAKSSSPSRCADARLHVDLRTEGVTR